MNLARHLQPSRRNAHQLAHDHGLGLALHIHLRGRRGRHQAIGGGAGVLQHRIAGTDRGPLGRRARPGLVARQAAGLVLMPHQRRRRHRHQGRQDCHRRCQGAREALQGGGGPLRKER